MAIQDAQKLDFLWKKIGYGFTKTDVNSIKAAVNESVPSPLLIRGDTIWVDSDLIPNVKPTDASVLIEVYDYANIGNGYSAVPCLEDSTASPNRTWFTSIINWIPPEFGSTYQIKVYADAPNAANPESTGTQLFAAGSGTNDEWFFDYKSGVLNFIGDNLPSSLNGSNIIYITGAVYAGDFGVKGQRAQFGNIILENNDIFVTPDDPDGPINIIANGTGAVNIQQSILNLEEDLNVTGIANFDNVLDSTDITSGSVVVDGGVGIAKTLYLGGDANLLSDLNVSQNLNISQDVDILGNIDFSGTITIDNRLFSINDLADGKNDPTETGQKNIALGFNSLGNVTSDANFNAVFGNDAAQSLTDGENNIIVGNNAEPSTPIVNNEVTIGNDQIDKVRIPGVDFEIHQGEVIIGDENGNKKGNLTVNGSATFTESVYANEIDGNIDGGTF
jgi:predicted acyltransferase (DUF342 family)